MKIGIIGLQGHQNYVLQGIRKWPDARIVAIADDHAGAVAELKRREKLAAEADAYEDWRMLLEHAMLDVCLVCGENGQRAEQLIALFERNVHVIAEKPLTTTRDDLSRVRAALAKSDSHLTMLLTMRYDAKYATLRRLVQSGAVGEVRQLTSQKSYRLGDRPAWFKSRERLGGTIPYIGIHALDLMGWTTGLAPRQLAAFHAAGAVDSMKETEDSATVLVQYQGGAVGSARLDYLRPAAAPTHGDDRLRIAGTAGVIEASAAHKGLWLMTADEPPREVPLDQEAGLDLFADFARSLEGEHRCRISAEEALAMTEMVLLARDAADEGKVVDLPPQAAGRNEP